MKKHLYISLVIVIVLLLGTIAYYRFRPQTFGLFYTLFPVYARVSVEQPIRFNHIHHKEVAKLDCLFCHRHADQGRSATLPNIELCKACHSTDAVSRRPEALKVLDYVKAGKKIPWRRMYELPSFVVFPHWIHIRNKIDCSHCHGVTGTSDTPVKMIDRDYMPWCIACHEKKEASTDCYTCHSS
jgi:c(7)-type cytochrome triheme protein